MRPNIEKPPWIPDFAGEARNICALRRIARTMTNQCKQRVTIADGESTLVNEPENSVELEPITLIWLVGGQKQTEKFTGPVTIGRHKSCDVRIDDKSVSRQHTRIWAENGQWHIADLDSGNGTFLENLCVHHATLPRKSTLRLGSGGPKIWIKVPGAPIGASVTDITEHYFGERAEHEIGHRTMMVRRAYKNVEKRQKRRYQKFVAAVAGLLSISIGVGIYQYMMLQKTRELATEFFYDMKTVQVHVANLEDLVRETQDETRVAAAENRRRQIDAMEAQYDRFLDELGVLSSNLSEKDRVILRVARMFGECELEMPPEFVQEVKNYIGKWKSTGRLTQALQRMQEHDLAPTIASAMLDNHLPPQFLYLALHESDFDIRAIGPETRFGIAKGIWQFIPSTALRYGLRTGPLVELPRHDPLDERFDPERATVAAAHYLRDLYNEDAQASGLLVIAAYNWGPTNIRKRIREMPENPRERNFWKLMEQHDIPQETYDYVLYIVSAIVIGENPALFGFEFDNPLKNVAIDAIDT